MRDLIRGRLGELSPAAFELLAAGAVLGRRFTIGHLRRVAGLAEDDCLAALEELLNRRLLAREEEDAHGPAAGYSFAHDKIRAVTYEGAGEERLRAFHRRALEVLGAASTPPAELARHARTAGLLADAFRHGLEAGDAAMKLSAARDAIANYDRARVLLFERDAAGGELWAALPAAEVRAVYVGLGRARELAGEAAEARAAYEELLRLAREAGERSLEWTALVRLAVLRDWEGGDPDGARGMLEGARRAALAEGSHAGLAETEWNLAQVEFFARGPRAALDHARNTLGLARRLGLAELTAHSSLALAYFGAFSGEWEEVPARARDARTCYTALREGPPLPTALRPSGFYRFSLFAGPRPSPLVDYRTMEAESLLLGGLGHVHLGRPREGLEAARAADHIGSETNSAWTRSGALLVLAAAATEAGEYGAAREAADGGLWLARELEHPHLPFRLLTLGAVRQATLQLQAARECFEEALTLSRNVEAAWTKPYEVACATWLCANRALAEDWGAAHDYARRASEARTATPVTALFTDLVRHHETEALLRGGGGEDAREDVRRFAERVGNNPRHRIPSFCQRAALARWEGRVGEAIEHLRSAARLAEDLDLPGQLWQLRAATGDLHRKLGDEAAARISYGQAARGLEVLAASIPDDALVEDFRRAPQVRHVYEGRRRGLSWTPLPDGPDAPTAAYGRWAAGG